MADPESKIEGASPSGTGPLGLRPEPLSAQGLGQKASVPCAVRIAAVQALDGHLTCAGPNDFSASEHGDAMSAAISWHLECGHLPAAVYWITAELPPLPTVPELRAQAEAGAFPKAFFDDLDQQVSS